MSKASTERTVAGLKVVIDRDLCIASKSCIPIAPELFELDSRQSIRFVEGDASADARVERDRLLEACAICPVDALSVFDGDERLVP